MELLPVCRLLFLHSDPLSLLQLALLQLLQLR